jgi:hypothetical protein
VRIADQRSPDTDEIGLSQVEPVKCHGRWSQTHIAEIERSQRRYDEER